MIRRPGKARGCTTGACPYPYVLDGLDVPFSPVTCVEGGSGGHPLAGSDQRWRDGLENMEPVARSWGTSEMQATAHRQLLAPTATLSC